ncbi:uncharacterized protein METZ01_LOCUS258119, partial [marine metagenome]
AETGRSHPALSYPGRGALPRLRPVAEGPPRSRPQKNIRNVLRHLSL